MPDVVRGHVPSLVATCDSLPLREEGKQYTARCLDVMQQYRARE